MARQRESNAELLLKLPWWVSAGLGVVIFAVMRWIIPEAIMVTSGKFTRDAQDFAAGKPIRLIDGPQLLALVRSVQCGKGGTGDSPAPSPLRGEGRGEVSSTQALVCPSCGQPMVLRTSRRGTNTGNQFWGCSTYPACKGTRKI